MKNLIRELVMLNAAFDSETFKDPQLRLDFILIIHLGHHMTKRAIFKVSN